MFEQICENPRLEPDLFNLVKTFQNDRSSNTCRKCKNENCHFHFEEFFTDHTIIAEHLPIDISVEERKAGIEKRNILLMKMKQYVNSELDPSQKNHSYRER